MKWFGLIALALLLALTNSAHAQLPEYTWTSLIPENDTRSAEIRRYDGVMMQNIIDDMNAEEKVFQNRLTWNVIPIRQLLTAHAPFCEIDFDPVHPPLLTTREKAILKEYLARGGFLVLGEDLYPYSKEQIVRIKSWSIIDYIIKDLPTMDHDFTVEKITESHPLFHQYYSTKIPPSDLWAAKQFPNLPDYTLVSYKGHPCAFVSANSYTREDGHEWLVLERPYPEDNDFVVESYAMNVNLYIYATMH